jgi:hypothetical protein
MYRACGRYEMWIEFESEMLNAKYQLECQEVEMW